MNRTTRDLMRHTYASLDANYIASAPAFAFTWTRRLRPIFFCFINRACIRSSTSRALFLIRKGFCPWARLVATDVPGTMPLVCAHCGFQYGFRWRCKLFDDMKMEYYSILLFFLNIWIYFYNKPHFFMFSHPFQNELKLILRCGILLELNVILITLKHLNLLLYHICLRA